MKYNRDIFITPHACQRLLERFTLVQRTGGIEDDMKAAEMKLKHLFSTASYLSDSPTGIVFRVANHDIDMIIQHRRMVTVFHANDKRLHRMDQEAEDARVSERVASQVHGNDINKPDAHIPPHLLHARRGRRC